ncbi:transposase, partial [Patescibacteria group bacterium]|nr:transposase [Patescibacteria group bacterium]
YERFIINLILFNTVYEPFSNVGRYDIQRAYKKISDQNLVKIHAFALLPNHFHFILEQRVENGIARFMHRVEMGYSRYFNILHSRSGNLFQGAYKIKHINKDSYLLYLPLYIYLNPLDLLDSEKDWKIRGIKNKTSSMNFLKNYPWSSLGEYLGAKNFPFISRDIFDSLYENPQEWEMALKDWLPEPENECS